MVPNRPTQAEAMREDEVTELMSWFQDKYDQFMRECQEVQMQIKFDGEALAAAFAAISDQLVLSTEQLLLIMDVIDGK